MSSSDDGTRRREKKLKFLQQKQVLTLIMASEASGAFKVFSMVHIHSGFKNCKKWNLGKLPVYYLSQMLKSMFFEIFSTGALPKGPGM